MQTKVIDVNSKIYPEELKKLEEVPRKIYVKGNESLLENKKISIIGSRKCSEYGKKMALNFAKKLSKRGYSIVSGLAYGIDSYAHIGGLLEKGKTIAVLPCSFNSVSSKTNKLLLEEIIKNGGLVISEYLENIEANTKTLKERNRIVAKIAKGVLVVEGDFRTGTTVTVKYAQKANIPIFCIPGNLDNLKSYTPNQLIKQGANLITNEQNIVDILENKRYKVSQREPKMIFETDIEMQYNSALLNQTEKEKCEYLTYNYIHQEAVDIDTIINISNLEINQINYELTMLLVEGYIKELPGKRYIRVKG